LAHILVVTHLRFKRFKSYSLNVFYMYG